MNVKPVQDFLFFKLIKGLGHEMDLRKLVKNGKIYTYCPADQTETRDF
jgi:hypothetical protein